MLGITDITTYLIGTIIIVLLPGPNSMYVLSVAAQRGIPRLCGCLRGIYR
jgi:leucine efflux protein